MDLFVLTQRARSEGKEILFSPPEFKCRSVRSTNKKASSLASSDFLDTPEEKKKTVSAISSSTYIPQAGGMLLKLLNLSLFPLISHVSPLRSLYSHTIFQLLFSLSLSFSRFRFNFLSFFRSVTRERGKRILFRWSAVLSPSFSPGEGMMGS